MNEPVARRTRTTGPLHDPAAVVIPASQQQQQLAPLQQPPLHHNNNNSNNNSVAAPAFAAQLQRTQAAIAAQQQQQQQHSPPPSAMWRISRLYCALSAFVAIVAIITAQSSSFGKPARASVFFDTSPRVEQQQPAAEADATTTNLNHHAPVVSDESHHHASQQEQPSQQHQQSHHQVFVFVDSLDWNKNWIKETVFSFFNIPLDKAIEGGKTSVKTATTVDQQQQQQQQHSVQNKLPPWLRWMIPSPPSGKEQPQQTASSSSSQPRDNETTTTTRLFLLFHRRLAILTRAVGLLQSFLDPVLLHPSPRTLTDLIDKIITSTPRLLAIANLLLSLTFLLHTAVADWFLGTTTTATTTTTRTATTTTTATTGTAAATAASLRNNSVSQDWAAAAGRERLGGFLVFKLLLISAVVGPDTLDLLILLSWYTLLSFLRSLSHLCAGTTQHTIQSGQPPRPGVLKLLLAVLCFDVLAAAVCVALFHGAGWGMVLLLTCDCALLALDVVCHILLHIGQVLEAQHSDRVGQVEARQLEFHQQAAASDEDNNTDNINNNDDHPEEEEEEEAAAVMEARQLDRQLEILERQQAGRIAVLETTVFCLQLFTHILTVGHFVHIWSVHGVQFTLIDGVLALHLHSALSSASKKIAERRNLHRIARDMDGMFDDATELELRKAAATGDVCCICLGTMNIGNVKKVGCGHLYHTSCLREVVERARSMEAARCPLCRASIMDGHRRVSLGINRDAAAGRAGDTSPNDPVQGNDNAGQNNRDGDGLQNGNNNGEHALFRFSTEGIFPAWLPVPAFSFEVVRRPTPAQQQDAANNDVVNNNNNEPRQSLVRRLLLLTGVVSMTPEEEALALEQLVDMFPQYDRADLLRELRRRGSSEAVAESILALNNGGVFPGVAPRDPTIWQQEGAVETR